MLLILYSLSFLCSFKATLTSLPFGSETESRPEFFDVIVINEKFLPPHQPIKTVVVVKAFTFSQKKCIWNNLAADFSVLYYR